MPRFFSQILTLILVLIGSACASYTDEIKEMRTSYHNEAYQAALEKLEDLDLKNQERNRLLYLLEKAMILERMGKRAEGRKLLLKADDVVDELYRSSLSGDIASFLYNDSTTDYQGEDYEKVAIHTTLALSFLEDENLKAATVEARRINTRLNEINSFYEDHKNRYREDAFARYLSGMIHESQAHWDDAIVDYRAALKLYEGDYSEIFDTPAPDQLINALHRLYIKRNRKDDARRLKEKYGSLIKGEGKDRIGEIVAIHEVDTIAIKRAESFIFPFGDQVVRFSFPVISRRSRAIFGRTGIKLNDKTFYSGELAQNMDSIASATLEDRRTRLTLKAGGRLILKGQMTQQAEKNFGVIGWLAGNIYGAVTETADTRGWTLLPSAYLVSRASVPPGEYEVQVQTDGRLSQIKKITVKPGQLVFLRDVG